MLTFFIKKAFFDGWDNLLPLVLVNLGLLPLLSPLLAAGIPGLPAVLGIGLALLVWFACFWWYAVAALVTLRWSDFGSFSFGDLPGALKKAIVPGLQMGALVAAPALALVFGLPFYLSRGLFGALAAGVLLWGSLAWFLGLQFYFPLRFRLGGGFRKNFRKCFVLLFDNPGFSLFLFVWNGLTLLLSTFLAFLAPGIAGLALAQNDAMRLRLLKYDWLEKEGGAGSPGRKTIPWKELLEEENELVGKRTLRGMIFPWKE